MALNLINDDECVIQEGKHYIKMNLRSDASQLHNEIINLDPYIKQFYNEFDKNITKFDILFQHILINMTPSERVMRLSVLPPIPDFICGECPTYLKVNQTQFKRIQRLAKSLFTSHPNLTRILWFISIPPNLYEEFPYLVNHYKFTEQVLNYYLEKTDSSERLQYYDNIKLQINVTCL